MTALFITIFCLLLLAFFQGAETAFVYSYRYRSDDRDDKDESSYLPSIIANFYRQPGLFLASLKLISVPAFLCGIYSEYQWLTTVLSPSTPLFFFLTMLITLLSFLIFGYALPRAVCGRTPDKALHAFAFPLYLFSILLMPLTRLCLVLPRLLLRLFRIRFDDVMLAGLLGNAGLTNPNLRPALPLDETPIEEKDLKIFRNALEFSSIRVRDCIVPRTEIVAIETGDSLHDLIKCFIESGKTKIIVYREDLDHIIGYVHSSDMFRQSSRIRWADSIRQVPVVPGAMSAQRMMQLFMQQKKSIAVVADEFGGTAGIISLEDLVEEIFGDIEDEHDTITYTARRLSDTEFLLSARLEIEKVNEQFSLTLPESDDYLTIGGLILFHYQDFPKVGETVTIGPFQFKILKTSTSKIDLVRLKVAQ